jgi:hypothetical protein
MNESTCLNDIQQVYLLKQIGIMKNLYGEIT